MSFYSLVEARTKLFSVFRELLQNSDDAASKAVEIHFETQAFVDRKKSTESGEGGSAQGSSKLPDLKTQHVCICHRDGYACLSETNMP